MYPVKEYFRFKDLILKNKDAAFKINTDGVLLAAWITKNGAYNRILDVGTGTGVIAIILAMKYKTADIYAIDIDGTSITEAKYNAILNGFDIDIKECALQEYNTEMTFDLIVSNPPYYENSTKPSHYRKRLAKHNTLLPPADFWKHCRRLSESRAHVAVIFPFEKTKEMTDRAGQYKFYPLSYCFVRGIKNGPIVRTIGLFGPEKERKPDEIEIYIREKQSGEFGESYKTICKDLYLDF